MRLHNVRTFRIYSADSRHASAFLTHSDETGSGRCAAGRQEGRALGEYPTEHAPAACAQQRSPGGSGGGQRMQANASPACLHAVLGAIEHFVPAARRIQLVLRLPRRRARQALLALAERRPEHVRQALTVQLRQRARQGAGGPTPSSSPPSAPAASSARSASARASADARASRASHSSSLPIAVSSTASLRSASATSAICARGGRVGHRRPDMDMCRNVA